jgi:hypothetical protein
MSSSLGRAMTIFDRRDTMGIASAIELMIKGMEFF